MQDYKSLRVAVMICATLLTHRDRRTEQLLTDTIRSASCAKTKKMLLDLPMVMLTKLVTSLSKTKRSSSCTSRWTTHISVPINKIHKPQYLRCKMQKCAENVHWHIFHLAVNIQTSKQCASVSTALLCIKLHKSAYMENSYWLFAISSTYVTHAELQINFILAEQNLLRTITITIHHASLQPL